MVIDLKNVDIWFVDGSTKTGAINLMAGYTTGATTVVVDGFTGQVPVGSLMTIEGKGFYTVTSTIETTGDTTSITFTPGLVGAVVDNDVVKVFGKAIKIKVGDGTITYSEKKPREYKKDRGKLDTVRNGDDEPIDVNITLQYEFVTAVAASGTPTPEDALKQRGEASTWVSSDTSDPCAPYCVDIMFLHTPPGCTTIDKELIQLLQYRYESLDHDPKAGTIQSTGKCNVTEATATRIPQS